MRAASLVLAVSLFAMPSFARSKTSAAKGPKAGQFCSKSQIGTTTQDQSGNTLTCKAGKKGKARWTK